MPPSSSLGKRTTRLRPLSHVSAQTTLLPKRPRKQCLAAAPSSTECFKDLQHAWCTFKSAVDTALHELRTPALDEIAKALARAPKGGQVPAVCVNMGAAAAAGDRAAVFNSIVQHVTNDAGISVLLFESSSHSTMSAVTQRLKSVEDEEAIIVAVEDADLFPEDTLRDLVYLCGKRREAASIDACQGISEDAKPAVAILFGLGTSADALHSALGIQEATVITPTNIDLPHATACFKVIVEQVLSLREQPILLSQAVYDLIETEFFARESTIAVVMRSLHQIFALHFYREPLSGPFSKRKSQMARGLDVQLSKAHLEHLRNNVISVKEELEGEPCDDEELHTLTTKWHSDLCTWQTRCTVVEQVTYELIRVLEIPERPWTKERLNHSDMRLHLFRAFLVTEDPDRRVDTRSIGKLIANRIEKGSRKQLVKVIATAKECIESCGAEDVEINDVLERLNDLTEDLENIEQKGSMQPENETAKTGQGPVRKTFAKGGAAAKQRRSEMLMNAGVQQKAQSALKVPRDRLNGVLRDFLKLIEPLSILPMHEIVLFSDTQALQDLCGGLGSTAEPRTSFFSAMRQPSKLVGSIPDAAIPDTAVAYRLLAEGGRMKNVYDWYHTFSTMRMAGAVQRDANGNITGLKDVSPAETQVRFSRVCAELEFLGLLKHTNRKTDHVLRLTFE